MTPKEVLATVSPFDNHGFSEILGLVNIGALELSNVIGKKLSSNRVQNRGKHIRGFGNPQDIFSSGENFFFSLRDKG